ncbi:lipase [Streptomyces camponoticapitis]|uniref:Lipase n=1 Tax=Streptomyces camponoticapitis TaxID=1616125 RepID=A0ABQ2ERC2_9ACTN|nr:SGNH/GDSL hydrolase family protein [Streptomyces camponoticapitis]GGK21052.1 lipase [Streptomyces camponoticapitis]
MQSVLETAVDRVVGVLETTIDATGVIFHRTPATARARMADDYFDLMSAVPSGVRLEALTDTPVLEFDVELTRDLLPHMTSPGSTFDLVVDGVLQDPVRAAENLVIVDPATLEMEFRPAGPATVRFELGEGVAERRVEIWFPASSMLKLLDVRVATGTSLRPAPAGAPLWVHHGSSISQCSQADRPTETWPATVARETGRSLLNLAIGGHCQLDQFMARTIRDLPASAISLELGTNVVNFDTMRERTFASAFHGFLDTVRDGHPNTPIAIVTPIICPVAEQRPGPTLFSTDYQVRTVERPSELAAGALSLTRVREVLVREVDVRVKEGDTKLSVIDGLSLFGPGDIQDMTDGLHPNAAGYRKMAARFLALAGPHGPLG